MLRMLADDDDDGGGGGGGSAGALGDESSELDLGVFGRAPRAGTVAGGARHNYSATTAGASP